MNFIKEQKEWTPEEEAVVMQSILSHWPKTYAAFREASGKLDRTFFSVKTRFYSYLKKRIKERVVDIAGNNADSQQFTALLKAALEKDAQKNMSQQKTKIARLQEENARLRAQLNDITEKANLVDIRYVTQLAEECALARRAVERLQKELLVYRAPRAVADAS